MYFSSFDTVHIVLLSLFLAATLGMVFFRFRNIFPVNEKSVNYTVDKKLVLVRITSLVLSLFLVGMAFLNPAGFLRDLSAETEGIDCVWLLDVSLSMDVPDVVRDGSTVSRLMQAKSVIENFILSHPENRYGLVIFAGKSRLVSPLTTEHTSLLTFLASIDSKSIREGGTDFREALSIAIERFDTKESTPRAIVLLSDGGDREDFPDIALLRELFRGKSVQVTTVGIGNKKPSPIPIGRNLFGETAYKTFGWETVLSGLNRENLRDLAEIGKWSYIEGVSPQKDLEKSLNTIARQTISDSWERTDDLTIRVIVLLSFLFFLAFLLLLSSFSKRWNAV